MNEELRLIISAEIDELKKELKKGQQEVSNFAKSGENAGAKFGKAMGAAGKATGAAMKAVGAAVVAGAAAIIGLAESTREYRTEQAKLVTAFESAGSSAEQATETYNDLYRVLGDSGQATEAAQHLAKLTNEEKALSEWTTICQGVYAEFGSSLPIESLTEAVNHSAKLGEVQGTLADALEWSGVNMDEFNEQLFWCNSESEREKLIRDTLNGIYSDSAAAYETNAASILAANEAQAALTAGMAALGEAVEPIVTIFKSELATILQELVPYLQTFADGLTAVINGVEGGAEKMSAGIQGMIDAVLTSIVELLPALLDTGVQIITAILNGLVSAFPEIVDTLAELIPQIITTIGELIPQITKTLLNALPQIIEVIFEALAQVLATLGEILPEIVAQIVEIIPEIVDTITENIPVLLNAAIDFLMAIVKAIPEIIPPLVEALPDIIDSILNCLLENTPVLLDASIELFMALVDAVPEIIPSLVKAIPKIINSLINALIKAIPKLLEASIKMFMAIVQAIPKIIPALVKGLGDIVKNVKTNLVEKLKSALKFKWELPKLKMPSISVAWKDSPAWMAEAAKFIGLEGIPSFKVSWNALGGVFDKPTLFSYGNSLQGIGEDGTEAVVPLEKNTEWLTKIADMLSDKMGATTPVILQIDGKTFAQTSINAINNYTRQTGRLALNLR